MPDPPELAPDTGSPEAFEKWLARAKKDPESAPQTLHSFGLLWVYLESKHGAEKSSRFLSEKILRAEVELGGVTSHGSRFSSGTRAMLMKHLLQARWDPAEQEFAQDADQDL